MTRLIFGRTWEEIQAMQQGKPVEHAPSPATALQEATQGDRNLLRKYGKAGLEKFQYYGVLERLKNSGIIDSYNE